MTVGLELTSETLSKLFGTLDENVRLIEDGLGVKLRLFDGKLNVEGDEENVTRTVELVGSLKKLMGKGYDITRDKVQSAVDLALEDNPDELVALLVEPVAITARGKSVKCRTPGQRAYVNAIKKNTLVFGVGPAGTGKTYLAVAMAVAAYKSGEADRIILTRPAIEAGEKLGFLPGDLREKVDPYLRPVYDALGEMLGQDNYLGLVERGVVEIAPLAYMRGRTLSHSFIILDEAQNATDEQMKMFLTRLGEGSKAVVNGDITQSDLPKGESGLRRAVNILKEIEGIAVVTLTEKDIVRHELVRKIVQAYAQSEKRSDG